MERYPTLESAQAESDDELKLFFKTHHVVRRTAITRRLDQIQTGQALTTDEGVVEPMQLLVQTWLQQLKVLLPSIQVFDQRIATLFEAQADAELFATLPGAGPHLAPRLLVAFGDDRSRYESSQEILRYVGIAPVKEKSGKKEWIH